MPLIKIVEQDLTRPGVAAQETDVVYIPGFVDTAQENLNTADGYVGIEPFKPTFFSDVKAFESLCGKQGAKFERTQKYTDLITKNADGTYAGFSANAVPQHRVMFYEGTIDPSYIMAKELLNAGLSIVYERINKDPDFVRLVKEPENWEDIYSQYYTDVECFKPISTPFAPEVFTQHFEGEEVKNKDAEYYSISEVTDSELTDSELKDGTRFTKISDNSTIMNDSGEFTKTCYSLSQKFYKFTHPVDTVEPKFETTTVSKKTTAKYFSIESTEAKLNTETFDNGTYYCLDDNNNFIKNTDTEVVKDKKYYTLKVTELLEEPINWGDVGSNFYTKNGDNFNVVKFTNTLAYEKGKFYLKDEDGNFTVINSETEPEIFNSKTVYEKTEFPEIIKDTNDYFVPTSWITDFTEYCTKDSNKILIESEDEGATAPEFDDFKDTSITTETVYNVYEISNFIDVATAYEALGKVFDASRDGGLGDKSTNIKYLTSGGYPVYEYNDGSLVNAMKSVANNRGDCVAFIDHTNNPYRTTNVNLADSLYATVREDDSIAVNGEFATMFTPWMNYTRVTTDENVDGEASPTTIQMSATYGYLLALADSLKTNASWLAVAGATRGQVPNLAQVATATPISNGAADAMQPRDAVSINAITDINPYGQTIWGNRTLKNNATEGNLTATSFLNIRHLISDVKKVCYSTARALTFEQNNDVLWVNFKSKISPTLDKMVSGYGISGYKIIRDTEHEKASEKATLCAKIVLYPAYAVEDFYITIVLTDDEVGVSE